MFQAPQPADPAHGEAFYAKLAARENALVEQTVARLMGSFAFLADAAPVQSSGALHAVLARGAAGKWFSLGEDVAALFFVAGDSSASAAQPAAAWTAYADHLALSGQKLQQSDGDISQRGGDVLIDPDGVVRLVHVGDGPAKL